MSSLSHKEKTPRISLISVICGLFLLLTAPAQAERKYVLGTSIDFMGGVSNQVGQSGFNLSRLEQGIVPFYSVYPSANLSSVGHHSTIDLNYTFVAERFQMTAPLTSLSHTVTGNFTAQLGRITRLRISDTFNTAPDYSTINVLQGFTITPEGFQYVFEPQLYKRNNISNSGNASLEVDVGSKSFLTFAASGSYRHYDDTVSRSYFTDQTRIEGSLAYSRRTSKRQSWSVKYMVWQNNYEGYYDVRSHAATLGLSRELRPDLHLTLEAGPSYTENSESMKSYVGYFVSAGLSKQLEKNLFTGGYSHHSGDSTGLGTASDSDHGNLGFSRTIGRKGSINFQASAFRQSQRETDVYDYWGANASLALSRQIGNHWVASIGGSYMTYLGATGSYYNSAYKRVYASIGFRFPELLRGER